MSSPNDRSSAPDALDPYTRQALAQGLSRRSFFTKSAAGTAGIGLLGAAGTASAAEPESYGSSSDGAATLSFLVKPRSIPESEIVQTLSFDVVVVGAGASGVPAALAAAEAGASVGVVQKHPLAVAQGNSGTGIDLARSDKAGVEALIALVANDNNHRCNPELLRQWAYHSGEAVRWVIDRAKKGGAQVIDQGNLQQGAILKVSGYSLNYVTSFFGPKPYTTGDGMRAMAKVAHDAGVKFHYRVPAEQLEKDDKGVVRAVIALDLRNNTYIRFRARKAVILATGDYQNNQEMCDYFIPDLKNFGRKQLDRTGDGFKMAYWAGGVIEPIGHTKMLHDFDAGPATMCDMPFLAVNRDGRRFVNETVPMSLMNNYLKSQRDAGHYCQIFDADYLTQAARWPGRLVPPEGLKNYMPDEPGEKKGVFPSQINTHRADTLEELARKLGVDAGNLAATVQRYNALVAAGKDEDFGKAAEWMTTPVLKPPFYGIHRRVRVSAITSGVLVDDQHRALDSRGKPIPGLYLIGNLGGGFYGGVDYPLTVYGMSLGRCYTFGYLTGRRVARL